MADLSKLADLSKRLKTKGAKTREETSRLNKKASGPIPKSPSDNGESRTPTTQVPAIPQASPTFASPVGGGGGGPVNVQVKVDLSPLQDILGRMRDELRSLKDEIAKTRDKGLKVDFGDNALEQFDQALKHMSAMSKAGRELAEKLVTSLPESRWYLDVLNAQRELGSGMAAGGRGGVGGDEIAEIKEQLEMQKTQLTAILSILQRR